MKTKIFKKIIGLS